MAKPSTIEQFLKNHLLQIAILAVSFIVSIALMDARVQALENKVAQYPEQKWFELKFDTIQKSIDENTEAIKDHIVNIE